MPILASDFSPAPYLPPTGPWVDIVHEDHSFLVLHKPAGLLSVPGKSEPDSLEWRVRYLYPEILTVHRLDMATSGVCVMARSKANLAALGRQFEDRETKKHYVAWVRGHPETDAGTIDLPLRCDWPRRPLQMVCHERGRPALTHWRVLERREGAQPSAAHPRDRALASIAPAPSRDRPSYFGRRVVCA